MKNNSTKGYTASMCNHEIWYDDYPPHTLRRSLLAKDSELLDLFNVSNKNHIHGITTNPIITRKYWENSESNWIFNSDNEKQLIKHSARILYPIFISSNKKSGYFCYQVSPSNLGSANLIVKEALEISRIAENVMVKIPLSTQGIIAISELYCLGVPINATLGFSHIQYNQCIKEISRRFTSLNTIKSNSPRLIFSHMIGRVEKNYKTCNQSYYSYINRITNNTPGFSELALAFSLPELNMVPNFSFLICSISNGELADQLTEKVINIKYPEKVLLTMPPKLVQSVARLPHKKRSTALTIIKNYNPEKARGLLGNYEDLICFKQTMQQHLHNEILLKKELS